MPHRHPVPDRPRRLAGRRLAAVLALATAASASYTIQPGDTLSGIAAQNGVPTRALAEANGLTDPDRIFAGRTLAIPGLAATPASSSGGGVHTVVRGETLSHIALRFGVPSAAIASANGIPNADLVLAGQRLTIPGGAAAATATPASTASTASTTSSSSGPPAGAAARAQVGALIEQTARAHGWKPAFVKALAWQESGWSNQRVSPSGAVGIMQVLPSTGTFVSQQFAGRTLDLNDPADNVLAGVLFLDYLHRLTGGDPERILAGYFQGLASVERNGIYASTRQYTANVLALRERF